MNLCDALADAIRGLLTPRPSPKGEEAVTLFPQEWRRDPAGLADFRGFVDAPLDDPALLARVTGGKLLAATLGAEGVDQIDATDGLPIDVKIALFEHNRLLYWVFQ